MNDQAKHLRQQLEQGSMKIKGKTKTKVVAVVSGKGGVGKSNVCLNLAVGLKQLNQNVLIMDLDLGMANIDILAGVDSDATIIDMIQQNLSIFDIIKRGPGGIDIASGGTGFRDLFQLDTMSFSIFMNQLQLLNHRYDYILFDMGAGITNDSLQFLLSANELLLVTTPEPTSITDGYAVLKTIDAYDQEDKPIYLIVNNTDDEDEGYEVGIRFKRAAKEFLDKEMTILGSLPFDRTLVKAVQAREPFILFDDKARVSQAMQKMIYTYSGQPASVTKSHYGHFLDKLKGLFSRHKEARK